MLTILLILAGFAVIGAGVAAAGRARPRDGEAPDLRERVQRLEQAIEAISGEVEKLAEAQRFTTALLEDRARSQPALRRPDAESDASGGSIPRPPSGPSDAR